MLQAVRFLKKIAVIVPMVALWSCAAVSQPAPDKGAEKLIRQNNGVAAIVFDEKGQATVVNKEGFAVPACQVCTPELERRFGPQCAKAPKASEVTGPNAKPADPVDRSVAVAPICNKLMGTNVQAVKPVTVIRHTGSQCMTFFFDNGGEAVAFQICW